jgi:alkanesulfonate monooxygenase SsuD/methylene tetrahydromethanopterin reductase-like flavin-dependent oxidoreductase (luciferase family)
MVDLAVQIESAGGLSWARWKRIVAEVERLGFRGLYCCDHFVPPDEGYTDSIELAAAFTYLADRSSRLEFGALVMPVTFRDPVFLARQAMTLDDLSGGRYILGVGAGWMEREHEMFGYPLGDRPERAARLAEALEVIARLTRDTAPVSFDGRFYRLREAKLLPRSPRPGGPRLLVGGSGPRRTLPLTARYADAWNGGGDPESFRATSTLLDELVVKAGRRPQDVRRTLMQQVICFRTPAELAGRLRYQMARTGSDSPQDTLAALRQRIPHLMAGPPAQVIEQIGEYAAAGVEEIMVQRRDLDDLEGLQIIAEEVLPHVSAGDFRRPAVGGL